MYFNYALEIPFYKNSFVVIYFWERYDRVHVKGNLFHPSLILAGKALKPNRVKSGVFVKRPTLEWST